MLGRKGSGCRLRMEHAAGYLLLATGNMPLEHAAGYMLRMEHAAGPDTRASLQRRLVLGSKLRLQTVGCPRCWLQPADPMPIHAAGLWLLHKVRGGFRGTSSVPCACQKPLATLISELSYTVKRGGRVPHRGSSGTPCAWQQTQATLTRPLLQTARHIP